MFFVYMHARVDYGGMHNALGLIMRTDWFTLAGRSSFNHGGPVALVNLMSQLHLMRPDFYLSLFFLFYFPLTFRYHILISFMY